MAFGKVALFSLACLALVNYSMAKCDISAISDTTVELDDIVDLNTPIVNFLITATSISSFQPPVVTSTKQTNAFHILYVLGATAETMNVYIYTGPEFGNLVDIHQELATFTPAIKFNCDNQEITLTNEFTITIADKNNQKPAFQTDIPNVIHFDLTKYNDTVKPILGTFHVTDADSTDANTAVKVEKSEGAGEVLVASTPTVDSQTQFTITLNAPIAEGQVNVTLKATNDGLGAGAETKQQVNFHTIQLYFTAPSSAIQQAGAFAMVTLFAVISGFAGKY